MLAPEPVRTARCAACRKEASFSESESAYLCETCGVWLTTGCGDRTCTNPNCLSIMTSALEPDRRKRVSRAPPRR